VQFAEFEDTINERRYVTEFAATLGFDAQIITPTRHDFLETFPDLARFIEFPVGSQSVLPLYCLARQARRDGYVVALSGEGSDRLSMGNSLEVRNPFLDHRLVELSARLADDLKFRDGQGKWVLREALRRLVGPDLGVVNRPVKHGLPAPVNLWLFKSSAFDRK